VKSLRQELLNDGNVVEEVAGDRPHSCNKYRRNSEVILDRALSATGGLSGFTTPVWRSMASSRCNAFGRL
jgi:hypothetical protein